MSHCAETKVGPNKAGDGKNAARTKQDGRRAVNCQKTGTCSYLWKDRLILKYGERDRFVWIADMFL